MKIETKRFWADVVAWLTCAVLCVLVLIVKYTIIPPTATWIHVIYMLVGGALSGFIPHYVKHALLQKWGWQ